MPPQLAAQSSTVPFSAVGSPMYRDSSDHVESVKVELLVTMLVMAPEVEEAIQPG